MKKMMKNTTMKMMIKKRDIYFKYNIIFFYNYIIYEKNSLEIRKKINKQ